jgi:hypothetical protein
VHVPTSWRHPTQTLPAAHPFSRTIRKKAHNAAFAGTGRISVTALCGITPKGIFTAETIVGSTITLYTDRVIPVRWIADGKRHARSTQKES